MESALLSSDERNHVCTRWVYEYGDALYTWALHKTSDKTVAEDLLQDTFLAAYQSYSKFKGQSQPKTWLMAILNNKITDYYRNKAKSFLSFQTEKEKQGYELTETLFGEDDRWVREGNMAFWPDDENLLDNKAFIQVMTECMDDLPEGWKAAVSAKYLLEKQGNQICQELGITPTNYWQILHRAKLMLKKCLELGWFKN